jgi:hypothetical protein
MSLFDSYRPATQQRCPVCLRLVHKWQGKDGPNGLFVWREGLLSPVEQNAAKEACLDQSTRERLRLPARFVIYSYDCPDHQPIEADCRAPEGVWTETIIRPFNETR